MFLHEVLKRIFHRTNSYFIPKHFLLHFKSIPIFSILNTLHLLWQNIDWNRKPCTFQIYLSRGRLSVGFWLNLVKVKIVSCLLIRVYRIANNRLEPQSSSSLSLSQYDTILTQTSAMSHCLSSTLRWYQYFNTSIPLSKHRKRQQNQR